MPKKGSLDSLQIEDGVWQKRGGVSEGGGDTPTHTMLSQMTQIDLYKTLNRQL